MKFWRHKSDKISFLLLLIIPAIIVSTGISAWVSILVTGLTLLFIVSKWLDHKEYIIESDYIIIPQQGGVTTIPLDKIISIEEISYRWSFGMPFKTASYLHYHDGSVKIKGTYRNENKKSLAEILVDKYKVLVREN